MLAREHTLPLVAALTPLFPEGTLRRGITITVHGDGATSLAFALAAAPMQAGSWAALVDLPDCNLVAAVEAGVALERLACVETGEQWAPAVAAALGAFDLVIVGCPRRVRAADARRLTARARERGAVVIVLEGHGQVAAWPEAPDLRLTAASSRWDGLGLGHGNLRARTIEVLAEGRRGFARPRRVEVVVPSGAAPAPAERPAPAAAAHTAVAPVLVPPRWADEPAVAVTGVARAG
jgi:hypothetical protein